MSCIDICANFKLNFGYIITKITEATVYLGVCQVDKIYTNYYSKNFFEKGGCLGLQKKKRIETEDQRTVRNFFDTNVKLQSIHSV